jgi:hypothetical protein
VTEPYTTNGLLLAFAEMLYGDHADADAAEQAFHSTDGTFLARIEAAINALLRPHLKPEKFIEIPQIPEKLTRADLDVLVRPVAEGFLRSQPAKDELLDQLRWIARRQASRPSWLPRTADSPGESNIAAPPEDEDSWRPISLALSGFPELGTVTIMVPAYCGDLMYPADSGHPAVLQMALLTIFGATDASAASRTIRGDWAALEALVPADQRWWIPPETTLTPRTAAEDAAAAVEVVATAPSLGHLSVQDVDGPEAEEVAVAVMLNADAWQHGPRIVVDGWQPADDSRLRSLARASFAGWASDTTEGFVVAVVSSGCDEDATVFPLGYRLHTWILWWTAPPAGATAGAGTLHRAVLNCPGPYVCPRGGCSTTGDDSLLAAVALVAADAAVTAQVTAQADWAADAHRASLLGTGDDEPEEVLSAVTQPLRAAGWEEISSSASELGDAEVLLSRCGQVLTVAYRPLSREVMLSDGRPELDMLSQLLADDGALADKNGGVGRVDRTAAFAADWSEPLVTVIDKYLAGGLAPGDVLADPVTILLGGLWPWGTGVPHGDDAWDLIRRQIMAHLRTTTLLIS